MIEKYIKFLESFKQHKISKLLERVDSKIFEILYSKHVSPRIEPYFPRYEFCFMTDETLLEPGKIYLREQKGKVAYSVLSPEGKPIKDALLEGLEAPIPFKYNFVFMAGEVKPEKGTLYVRMLAEGLEYTVIDPQGNLVKNIIKKTDLNINLSSDKPTCTSKDLEPFIPSILEITSKRHHTLPCTLDSLKAQVLSASGRKGHTQWAPFRNFSLDPNTISQIKKLINALWYARLTFKDFERIDFRNIKQSDLKLLYCKTINQAYEASHLITHLDVDIKDMFSEEFAIILPLLGEVRDFAENNNLDKKTLVNALQPKPLTFKTGKIAGIMVDQIRPLGGDIDYNFLTQFSAVLPSYIDQLTHHIQQYSSQIKESEPKLNQERLEALQNAALNLLNDIENLKGSSVFVSLKFLNYIHIIRNIITLSMSSFEQIGELSESSQDLVRDKLAHLKYSILPTLFGLVDKIEDYAMLKPGTLSAPLMEKVKVLYDALLYLPKKAIDFKAKGEELLDIEDSKFIELRLEMTYKRINEANKSLYKIQKAREACKQFFILLNNPLYKNFRLYELPIEVKKELIEQYKLIKPYMTKLDIDLNALIVARLTGSAKEDWFSYLGTPYRWLTKQPPLDHINSVLEKQKIIEDSITKDENSQLFHIHLNKDLIASVHKNARLVLFPHNDKTNVYSLDESIPLQIERDVEKQSKRTRTEFEIIQKAYIRFAQLIKEQMATNPKLYETKLALNALEGPVKAECERLYKIFQPYLDCLTSSEFRNSAKNLKHYLDHLFAGKTIKNTPTSKLFIKLDNDIHDFFTRINFEWFDKTEFDTILNAYTRFSQLIKSELKEKPQFFESTLLLNHFDAAVQRECLALYKIVQPYLKFALSPELKSPAENFERYFAALLANKPLDILEAPSTGLFFKLDKTVFDFLSKWKEKRHFFYNIMQKKFLSETESTALRLKRIEDEKLHFKTIEGDKFLQNQEQLSSDQALELYQWYHHKDNKLLVAHNAYLEFIELLHKSLVVTGLNRDDKLLLNTLEPSLKNQLRNLYNIFQPYFIGAVPAEIKEDALQFDKYLVASLSPTKMTSKNTAPLKTFLNLGYHFQEYFTRTHTDWNRRTQSFYELAQHQFHLETDATELKPERISSRAHYVMQHTNYSKAIHEFRIFLFQVTKLFNRAMQAELTPKESGVPFPEMEENNQRLTQSRQVCALKDIYNSLYHLEQIVIKIEELNDKSYKLVYMGYLLFAYWHINEIIKLSQRLAGDPHWGFIARELLDKARTVYASVQEHSDVYQVGAEQIPYGSAQVHYNSLWYILNAFYISPKHIRALKNNNYLTSEELNELHRQAKKTTLVIEGLINHSDSYFKLFLQTPNMIYLYQALTKKLNEFTSTSHDTVLYSLDKMRSKLFTPMLLEADRGENKLGLAPGSLSGPLRHIINEFIKGFLLPLNLKSQKHIALVCDKEPLKTRTNQINKQRHNAQKYLKKIDREFQDIEHLYQCIQQHKLLTAAGLTSSSELTLETNKKELQALYKKSLPLLVKLKLEKKIDIAPSQYPEDHRFDDMCNFDLKDYDPHFTEVEALITASHHYYLGLKSTHQLRWNTTQEKLDYLTELVKVEEEEKVEFIEKYASESFEKQLTVFCNRHIGLQYTDKEYRAKLKEYLLTFKAEIIASSKIAKEINRSIKNLLKEKISVFEKKHYAEYYHLDSVRVAFAQFKIYFKSSTVAIHNKHSLFENDKTLDDKTKLINDLDAIAENAKLSIAERLDKIKNGSQEEEIKGVKDPNFSRIILAQKEVNPFSFTYLKLCFLSLLEALHLYTPKRALLLTNIKDAVNSPPEISELTKRFGLFNTTAKANDDGGKRYAAPTLPAASVAF